MTLLAAFACVLPACAALAQPLWIGPPATVFKGTAPSWVWVPGPADKPTLENAPAGTVWLGKEFEVPEGASRADLFLAADNSAECFLDGQRVLASTSWSGTDRTGLTLAPGRHLLTIRAENGATEGRSRNPAGVIALLAGREGSPPHITTDDSWRGQSTEWPGFPAAAPPADAPPVTVLGPVTSPPWNLNTSSFLAQGPCPILRRDFTIEGAPARATIRIIGLGHYELRCNGNRVGETLVNQAWSQYDKTLYWQEFDITPLLREGPNTLGVMLGNSFWHVSGANDSGRYTKTDTMPDFSAGRDHLLWLDASIISSRGKEYVTSDKDWTWTEGPLTFSNIFAGEDYDARKDPPNWDRPGVSAAAWKPVEVAPAPAARLAALPGPGIKAFQTFAPVDILPLDDSSFTLVFEQNCSALLRFTLEGPAGATVRFRPCEYQDNGRVKFTYTWGTGKDIWFDYTLRGGGPETHTTKFCFVGAQYVQINGAVPRGADNPHNLPVLVGCQLVHTRAACPEVGTFTCSDVMQTGAHRMIDWSIRSNMAHYPMDCPHREKCSWLEEDWHMARALSYRFDIHDWYTKLCHDIRDTQLDDGHVPTNSPNYLVGVGPHGFWNEAPEWGIASVLVPWHLYEWYGDQQILRDSYESMKKYVDYLDVKARADGGLLKSNLGDWYDYGHGKGDGPSQWTPSEVSAMAVFALGAKAVADTAAILGRDVPHALGPEDKPARIHSEQTRYRTRYEQIKRAFQVRLYDPLTKTVKNNGSCQAGNAAALCAGLIPDKDRAAALQAIIDDLEKRNYQQTVGEVLQAFFVRALAEAGRNDILHKVYARHDRGGYGFMVDQGLTTLPESWDAKPGTGNSMNHFMLGHLMEWHFAYVAGIRQAPGSIGWNKILIAPNPGVEQGVTSAEATFNSPRGKITSRWEVTERAFKLIVEVPAEAELVMPDGSTKTLPAGKSEHQCQLK